MVRSEAAFVCARTAIAAEAPACVNCAHLCTTVSLQNGSSDLNESLSAEC
jgi:hypothetical protein